MNTRCIVQGVYVTLVDAEHCPGAAIILFEIPVDGDTEELLRIVHTGDFRASRRHVDQIACVFTTPVTFPVMPLMLCDTARCREAADSGSVPPIDYIYLDTTYLEPTYSFPCQRQVIATVGEVCYKLHTCPDYLPSLLSQASDSRLKSKQLSKATAQPIKKSVQITQWFKPLQKLFTVSPSASLPMANDRRRRVLFVVGTYTIGKEKLFVEIARR
ncbi:repair protein PSO2 SNM1, partial [Coemansia aciculifera]